MDKYDAIVICALLLFAAAVTITAMIVEQ